MAMSEVQEWYRGRGNLGTTIEAVLAPESGSALTVELRAVMALAGFTNLRAVTPEGWEIAMGNIWRAFSLKFGEKLPKVMAKFHALKWQEEEYVRERPEDFVDRSGDMST